MAAKEYSGKDPSGHSIMRSMSESIKALQSRKRKQHGTACSSRLTVALARLKSGISRASRGGIVNFDLMVNKGLSWSPGCGSYRKNIPATVLTVSEKHPNKRQVSLALHGNGLILTLML